MKRKYSNKRRQTVVEVGENVFLPSNAKITVPKFIIGDNSRINGPIVVRGQESCFIGKYCAFGYHNTIITTNHDVHKPNLQINMNRYYGFSNLEISKGPVRIGNNVWVGDNTTILSGVTIGDGCVIGAGAVVNNDVPPCSICGGVPAKVIKYRFSKKVIDAFLELKWWDWSEAKIARNRKFFETDLSKYDNIKLNKLISE
jgi:virginiamycin A acetyltransferase